MSVFQENSFNSLIFDFHRKHPYLLFNEDGQSMTFLGCSFSIDGHLIDIVSGDIIQREIIGKNLRAGLAQNGVEFNEDYTTWNT